MKKRTIARLVPFTLAAFAVLGGFLYQSHLQTVGYHRMVVNTYKHAFNELVSGVSELDNSLQKCLYAGTGGMLGETCVQVYGAAQSAKQSLTELPYSDREFDNMSGFISKIGDYVFALSKKASRGTDVSEEERKNLKSLSETASVLSGNLTGMLAEVNDGSLSLDELDALTKRTAARSEQATGGVFIGRVKSAESEFPEIPTLMYDGPFSSHISGMKPLMLEGRAEVAEDEARRLAEEFTGIKGLTPDGERGGNLPVYTFSAPESGGTASVEVSKAGGVIVNVFSSHIAHEARVSAEQAVKTAREYLDKRGFGGMRESYRMTTGNVVTVNFAATVGDVICYPDLIKVEVALDSGAVVGFEAQGYVMHHREREIPQAKITEAQAKEKVSPQLKILTHELAIIPTGGENEVLCHEFKCENESGQHYVVCVNADTGAEERILILVESDDGVLAV
ncbi:MAG: germination protein YpeB [Oscillospiraceae bacterium]|nr:germination protein YpeB [Oscillospiraceae bacterium]